MVPYRIDLHDEASIANSEQILIPSLANGDGDSFLFRK